MFGVRVLKTDQRIKLSDLMEEKKNPVEFSRGPWLMYERLNPQSKESES